MTWSSSRMPAARSWGSRAALVFGFLVILAWVVGLLVLMERDTYDTWGALLVGPALVLISLPMLRAQARRESRRGIFVLLVVALLVKLSGALVRDYFAFEVYEGAADAGAYHEHGARFYDDFRVGDFEGDPTAPEGTRFINFLITLVYAIIGPTRLGGFLVFSWMGFVGLFLFYRAFTIALPREGARSYAWLLFFLPSLVYWPSSIGKEAWMMLALGVVAFGTARVLVGSTWRGLMIGGLGLWLSALVRPHMAGIAGVALAAGFLLRRPRPEHRELAPVVKGLSVAVFVVLAAVLVVRADEWLRQSGVDLDQGVDSALAEITDRTSQGGSEFVPSVLQSPLRAPVAIVTVLFRPLVFEAHNVQAFVAALEGTFLLGLSLLRVRGLLGALRSLRAHPYVGFAIAYVALFVLSFSSLANFGILVRQRTLLLPVFMVLLAFRTRPEGGDGSRRDRRTAIRGSASSATWVSVGGPGER